ncbi:TIGR03503 family protein [Pseudoalteromonas sp. 1181_04]|nr:TIGR03503 family protein [Pseudoalteromonas sp. SG44-1]MBB1435367.1 TIGR03503 family protein [Pseudoalteromonas sp. SG43-6]MBB1467759.1 TIGR03503 family protein [Pseudoalteromonas sp. SG41-5]MBB1480186.1 TIGR03503 family protein [Pseudoalteromonas sp. SG41-2]
MRSIMLVVCLVMMLPNTSSATNEDKITLLQRDGRQNEIPLLENRFRIDYKVDEITLLFFRKPGAPAVVLVKPDGSKYYATSARKDDNLQWFDELSYDLITIKQPMPGPWQVVGSILPKSRIVVLGEVELQAEPLPPLLFRGETVKITGQILNDGEPIQVGLFRDVVSLNVDFISTNNSDFANFGAGTQNVAEFKDDGRGFDERPKDGIFTGEFKLVFPAGQWRPELYIETPLLKRTVVQDLIEVKEPPFSYEIALAEDDLQEHHLTITLDNQIVQPETVLIQGKIYYPNNEEQMFTLDAKNSLTRQLTIKNYDWGRYSVELSVFGTNVNGREFMATLPTYKFEIERPIEVVPELPAPIITPAQQQEIERVAKEAESMATITFISLIVGGNLLVLLLGWLAIRVFVQKKSIMPKINLPFLKKKTAVENEPQSNEKKELDKNGSKSDRSGEILNLSMSDD